MFTAAGRKLQELTDSGSVDGYGDVIREYLQSRTISIISECNYRIVLSDDEKTFSIKMRNKACPPEKLYRNLGIILREGRLEHRDWWESIISGDYQNYYAKMYSNR